MAKPKFQNKLSKKRFTSSLSRGFIPSERSESRGQGLIEVIVSIALIVIAILGALSLATYSIRAGTQSRERVQAALLAQEGIEIVKNIRDTNWIKGYSWNEGFPAASENFYKASYVDNETGWKIEIGQETGIQGIFTRSIKFPEVSNDKITVRCEVSWTDNSGTHTVTAIDYITNWQGK
jgi:type II secretory pathway pseudopilin PulG